VTTVLRSKYPILAGMLLAMPSVHAADPPSCSAALEPIAVPEAPEQAGADPNTVTLEIGSIEALLGADPKASMTGGILLRQGRRLAGADEARYDPAVRTLYLEGQVRYEDPDSQVASDLAEFSYDFGRIRFEGARFALGASNAHGAAEAIEVNQKGRLELDNVSYTTCPPGSNDWLLEARDIDLDTRSGVGTARGMKLRFQGVPILYSPYLSFPIGEARKSGILAPEFGSTRRGGTEIVVPYYWNIAPNYDATITSRYLTDRGLQMQTEFRYLTKHLSGTAQVEHLASDNMTNAARTMGHLRHRTLFGAGWRNRIDYQEVSDNQYFEDLGGSLSISSITHLNRSVSFDHYTDSLSLIARFQDYQTIDDAILPDDEPYQRLPQFVVRGRWPDQLLGMQLAFDGELVNFDREVGVTGWRLNLAPEIEWPIARPGWFITPAVALDHTQYSLDETLPGEDDEPSRTLPIGSLDVGILLERTMKGGHNKRIQTIEPRMLYVHVPYREQSGLPVFDTIVPDLNLVQLFRKNRYLGVDRIADTDQVAMGVTSRVLDVATGRELMSATVGQTRYLSLSGVALPGESLVNQETSDYIAELRFLLSETLNFDVGHQWGENDRGTVRSEARLQYRPASNKVLNVAYRFRRDSLEQGDLSWSWPIATKWNFVGRYNYSLRDSEPLEQFFGFEYESCCWGIRFVSRRHISTRDGTRDSSFGLQLILKGMSSVGTATDKLLERGILGYSADL